MYSHSSMGSDQTWVDRFNVNSVGLGLHVEPKAFLGFFFSLVFSFPWFFLFLGFFCRVFLMLYFLESHTTLPPRK